MKRFLRFVPLMVLLLVLVLLLPQQANAATSGYYTYTVSNGEATITDVGTAIRGDVTIPSTLGSYPVISSGYYTYTVFNGKAMITDVSSYISGDVTIPSTLGGYPVTSIGSRAFYGCDSLTSITIPDSVTSIGYDAFSSCDSLTSVTIGDSVTSIGYGAFRSCTSLTSVTIGDSVTSIGYDAFYNCDSLTSVTIGNSVTSIGNNAFWDCTSLTSVNITDIASWCGISFADYYSNPLYYAKKLYVNGELVTDLIIPDSVINIGKYAFYKCTSLTSVTIPDSVTSVGNSAFSGCTNLTRVNITDITSWYGISFASSSSNPLYYARKLYVNGELVTDLIIPDGVTSVGSYAFYNCDSLTSITIPDSVTSVGNSAFSGCASLADIWVSEKNTVYASDEYGVLYNKDKTTLIQAPAKGITDAYTIPDSVTSVGSYAFSSCDSLTSMTIPDSVTSIGGGAFCGCSSLESITIPFVGDSRKTASDIYQRPFGYIFGTSSYTGGVATEQYYHGFSTTSTAYSTYYIPSSLKTVTVTGGNLLYGAFYSCTNLTSVTIGDSVTSIGKHAFYHCDSLTSITIPDSVTSIGDYAFQYCKSLTSVTIGNSVTSIGSSAFSSCDSLTSVTIGNSVTSIGSYAFSWCTSLTSITIPDSVTSIGSYAFCDCESLTSVTIGDSVTRIGEYAFYDCDSLTNVTIPDSVTSIGSYAFSHCASLKHVAYGGTSAQWSKINIDSNNTSLTGASVWHYEATQVDVYYTKNCINAGIYCHLCNDFITKEKEEPGEHSYDNSCDEECDDCGEIRIVTHNYAWVVDKAETCGENGAKHEECTLCHSIRNYSTVIAPTGNHSYYDDCDETCNVCDYERSVPHNYTWVIDKAETCGENGAKHEECTACHNVRNAETVIEATGNHTYETGGHVCSVCGYGRTVTAIAMGKAPAKRYYSLLRDELDVTGGTIIVTYSDGPTEEIAITADMVTAFDNRVYGRQSLKVTYSGARAYFTIIVQADYTPDKLEILTKPKISYILGESLDLNGLTVKATYEDVEVELALAEVSVDVVDLTTIGSKTVTVRYYDAVATVPIFVHEKVWFTIDSALYPESKHNYAANTNETKTFTHPGAEQLKLTFSSSSYTESNYDFVYILDGNGNQIGKYSGTLSGKVVTIPGDTVQIKLTSDDGVNKYGYAFSSIRGYVIDHPGEDFCEICGELKATAGKTVVLQEDKVAISMTIPAGATLDLNGYTLTVDSLVSFGQIIDSVGGGGLIATNIEMSGNDWLPIKDESGCYRFYEYEQESLGTKTTSDGVSFGFALDFVDETAYTTLLESNDVQITITLDWGSGSKDYAFSRELVAKYVDWVRKYPSLQPAMQLNVTGLDSLEEGTVLTVTPAISAVGGKIQTTGAIMTYTA